MTKKWEKGVLTSTQQNTEPAKGIYNNRIMEHNGRMMEIYSYAIFRR